MRRLIPYARLGGAVPLLLMFTLMLAACSGATTTVSGPNATTTTTAPPAATNTPAPPPPHALAWSQYDHANNPQIWASINDGAPAMIAQYPQNTNGCSLVGFGPPMFSPDLTHILVALGAGCTDGQLTGALYIVNAANGQITPVPMPANTGVLLNDRSYAWVSNTTIVGFAYISSFEYQIGAGSVSSLPGITNAVEGVVRGHTLFYLEDDGGTNGLFNASLHSYNLSTHSANVGTINLGGFQLAEGSPGDFHFQGWDAAPDGQHLVYQVTTPKSGIQGGIASSKVYYSSADGNNATLVAQYMVTGSLVRMRISPNDHLVAITTAYPSPDIISACVSSPGKKGDPCFHSYSPDVVQYPAWWWDSSSFIAASNNIGDNFGGAPGPQSLYRFTPNGNASAVYAAGGYNPWSTP